MDYLDKLIKHKAKVVKDKIAASKAQTGTEKSLRLEKEMQLRDLKNTLNGRKPSTNNSASVTKATTKPSSAIQPTQNAQNNTSAQHKTSVSSANRESRNVPSHEEEKNGKHKESLREQPKKVNRELTEAEKRRFIEMIEENANIGYVLNAESHKKEEQEYDPLQNMRSREIGNEGTDKNFSLMINQHIRKQMGVSDNVDEIKRKLEEKARREKELLKQSEQRHQVNGDKNKREKSTSAQQQMDKKIVAHDSRYSESELRKLRNKLNEKPQRKPTNKDANRSADSQNYKKNYYPTDHKHSNNNGREILQQYDPESREVKSSVHVISASDSKSNRPQQKLLQKSQVPPNRSNPPKQQPSLKLSEQQRPREIPLNLNILAKRDLKQRRKQTSRNQHYDEDEESDLSDFIEKDEYDPLEPNQQKMISQFIKNTFGPRGHYEEDDYSSDMEARYDDIEAEERRAAKIARQEDRAELKRIQMDEEEERLEKKLRKLQKKRLRQQ